MWQLTDRFVGQQSNYIILCVTTRQGMHININIADVAFSVLCMTNYGLCGICVMQAVLAILDCSIHNNALYMA